MDIFYQAYGVIRRGSLDTNFDDDSVPLNFLAARGELNASVRGTIAEGLTLTNGVPLSRRTTSQSR